MKTDISFLPERKQEELKEIIEQVRKEIHNCEMIILYGSYASGNFVIRDERIEYNVPTLFMSDFDILVLTAQEPTEITERKLAKIDNRFCNMQRTPIQFMALSVQEMNNCLEAARYFHKTIKEKGILLYSTGNYVLTEGHALDYPEVLKEAERYFNDKFSKGESFLRSAAHAYDDGDYPLLSFNLHQACEFFFLAILLTYTLSNWKIHDLGKLLRIASKYAPSLKGLFSPDNPEEKYIFNLLKKAYKEGRYNEEFKPTKEEVEAQRKMACTLRDMAEEICNKQVEYYRKRVAEEDSKDAKFYPENDPHTTVADTNEDLANDKDHYAGNKEKEDNR